MARERLANPEYQRTSWLATTRPDGRPHLMPVITTWIDDAIHLVVGEGTRKGRNLAADGHCVVATSSTTLPSLDIVIEGRAEPVTDEDAVRHLAEVERVASACIEVHGEVELPLVALDVVRCAGLVLRRRAGAEPEAAVVDRIVAREDGPEPIAKREAIEARRR